MAMPSLEVRVQRLEETIPSALAMRAALEALRRARAAGHLTAEDAEIVEVASLDQRSLERELTALTDEELREGIELLRALPGLARDPEVNRE